MIARGPGLGARAKTGPRIQQEDSIVIRNHMKTTALGLFVALAGASAFFAMAHRNHEPTRKTAPLAAERRDDRENLLLRQQMDLVNLRLQHLEQSRGAAAAAVRDPPEKDIVGDTQTPTPPSPEEVEQAERVRIEKASTTFDRQLAKEAEDVEWARSTEANIRSFVPEQSTWRVKDVLCKSTLCRVTFDFDESDREKHLHDVLGKGPFDGDGFFHPGPDGKGMILYSSRPGTRLPVVDFSS